MLIGFCSLQPQVGKTTASEYLVREKKFLHVETNEAIVHLSTWFFGYNGNKKDPQQRKILQEIGLAGKNIDPAIWTYQALNLAKRRIVGLAIEVKPIILYYFNLIGVKESIKKDGLDKFLEGNSVVLSGIRNPGEADAIKEVGGKVVLIKKGNLSLDTIIKEEYHPVESQLLEYKNFDHIIQNDGTIEDMCKKIDDIVEGETNGTD